MTIRRLALALGLLALCVTPAFPAKVKPLPADHPFLHLLAGASVERGREHRALLVYPIAREQADPADLERPRTSREAFRARDLTCGEPEKKEGRGPVELFNWSTEPILLLAGEVLAGGYRDRFLARDALLGPATRVPAPAYVADRKARPPEERKRSLEPVGAVAPSLLRLLGLLDGPAARARTLLEDQFVMAGDKDPRRALPRLFSAQLLQSRAAEYRTVFAAIPDEAKKRTVGYAALVGERLLGIELFGSNASFRAHWPTLLRTLAHEAALYEASYGILNLPLPAGKDPDRHLPALRKAIQSLVAARYREQKPLARGTEYLFSNPKFAGRLLMDGKRIVHALVLADTLTNAPDARPPRGTGSDEYTRGELERRAERSRLTEYERRLLERMRQRDRTPPSGPLKPDPGETRAPDRNPPSGPLRPDPGDTPRAPDQPR